MIRCYQQPRREDIGVILIIASAFLMFLSVPGETALVPHNTKRRSFHLQSAILQKTVPRSHRIPWVLHEAGASIGTESHLNRNDIYIWIDEKKESDVQQELWNEEMLDPSSSSSLSSRQILFAAAEARTTLTNKYPCRGYFIRPYNCNEPNVPSKCAMEVHIDCEPGSSSAISTGISVGNDTTITTAAAVLHKILLYAFSNMKEIVEDEDIIITYKGLDPKEVGTKLLGNDNTEHFVFQHNLPFFLPLLNQYAFQHRGTEQGRTALELLEVLGKRRVAFKFDDGRQIVTNHNIGGKEVVSHMKEILSPNIVEKVMKRVSLIRRRNWLSTNPDSVDGLPSLHLNLISGGEPLFEMKEQRSHGEDDSDDENMTFEECITDIVNILRSPLYDMLLPAVRKLTKSNTVEISDVFIRNYGRLEIDDGTESTNHNINENNPPPAEKTRYGLSPHYDITAFATCVMALDSTAASGKNGLYTIPTSKNGASNHSALRKFFPLEEGDGVVHTYDILHGVDVDPSLNCARTSLIVWFTDYGTKESVHERMNHPWLLNPCNHVDEFILALASEYSYYPLEDENVPSHHAGEQSVKDPLELYLSSASKGNVFAMTQLGQLCDDEKVDSVTCGMIQKFLHDLHPMNPFLPKQITGHSPKELAAALWYHAGILGGNRVAQISLADELMLQFMSSQKEMVLNKEKEEILLMASTLFVMALFQGYDSSNSLMQLMDINCQRLRDEGLEIPSEAFFDDPVIKTLMLAL